VDVVFSADFDEWARRAGLLAVYAHGSRARGRARADSDLDLAVLLAARSGLLEEESLCLELESRVTTPHRLDVRIFNDAPPAFQFRVIRDHGLLWEADRTARVRFEARVFQEYQDQQYYRDQYDAALRRRIQEGAFGRRPAIHRPSA